MSLVSPTQSNPGDEINASDINNPVNQIAAVINGQLDDTNISSFSGTKITSGTVPVAAMDTNANPETRLREVSFDFVASGCRWAGDAYASTRNASMTPSPDATNVVYIGGTRVVVANVTARAFTASKDTYIDVTNAGVVTYTEVANNAASPALAANSIRLGIIVTGASNIAAAGSVNQGEETMVLPIVSSVPYQVTDSLGNLICPRDPNRKILGYKQRTTIFSTSSTIATDVTGVSVPVIVPNGRKIKITGGPTSVATTSGSNAFTITVSEGATILQKTRSNITTGAAISTPQLSVCTTPLAGLHTYKVQVLNDIATNIDYSSGVGQPIVLIVELD